MPGKHGEQPMVEDDRDAHANGTVRTVRCPTDGTLFESRRSNARYCSAACRAQASRERRAYAVPARSRGGATSEGAGDAEVIDLAARVSQLEDDLQERDLRVVADAAAGAERVMAARVKAMPAPDQVSDAISAVQNLSNRVERLESGRSQLPQRDPHEAALRALIRRVEVLEVRTAELEQLGVGIADLMATAAK